MRITPIHTTGEPPSNASPLVGTWEFRHRFMSGFKCLSALKVYTFHPDGTGVYSHLDNLEKFYNYVMIFTYFVEQDRVILAYEAENRIDTILFSVEQNKMTLVNYNSKEVYTRYPTENKVVWKRLKRQKLSTWSQKASKIMCI